ncbi:periplasmic protease [Cyanobium gracile PCC 6307]|uniref:Periplasmic protease n=2 Tax=Cyanobium gracile TaxID=59930 RepID=K9P6M8_CYAGP|nr:periplasmic protease [Cyanobium gracile PCC 6307]
MSFDLQPYYDCSPQRLGAIAAAGVGESRLLTSPLGRQLARQFVLDLSALTSAAATGQVAAVIYPLADRRQITAQLRLVIRDFYVHLGLKRAQYGFDPVRALELLSTEVENLSDAEFHQSITQLVARTRDRHLTFYGPTPVGIVAVLPFMVERAWECDQLVYVVSKLEPAFKGNHLKAGAIVTHWNNVPIDRFVRLNANVFDGGNDAASVARSVEFLTRRPLQSFGAPFEEWVELRFNIDGTSHKEEFAWQGLDLGAVKATPAIGRNVIGFGGDPDLFDTQQAKRIQFAQSSFDPIYVPEALSATAEPGVPSILGRCANFEYGTVLTEHGLFGYVRLWNFAAYNSADDIARKFVTVLPQLPQAGIVLDIRGNTGGYIAAGERILQLLTPSWITPTRFQFKVNEATSRMVKTVDLFAPWKRSFSEAARTGEPFSQGLPIEGTDEDANQLGQYYFGPVVLVTDALAYSTADIFAAGFIDHGIGKVICIDKNMAAAGGNNWQFEVLRLFNPDFQLDGALRADLDDGVITPAIRAAFNAQSASLTEQADLSPARPEFDGTAWQVTDGAAGFVLRHVPWMNDRLNVYQDVGGHSGVKPLPTNVSFGFTVRRCMRVGKSEGRLLEDLGIEPDVVYRPTLRDVMDRNRDLLTRATLELSQMPSYLLAVDVRATSGEDAHLLLCRGTGLTLIEAYEDERFIALGRPSEGGTLELLIPGEVPRVILKGWAKDQLVARRVVATA